MSASSSPAVDAATEAGIRYVQETLSPSQPLQLASRRLRLDRTGVSLHYVRGGPSVDDPACRGVLLFVHGWPDCWFGWRYQLAHFAARGFLCLVPDTRGFGATEFIDPAARKSPENYSWQLVCKDLEQLLEAERVRRVLVVGHDWGGAIAWSFVRRYPTLCAGVAALCTPYRPSKSTYTSPEDVAAILPIMYYQVHFSRHRKEAAAELDADPERSILCLYRGGAKSETIGSFMNSRNTSFLQNFPQKPPPSSIMNAQERAVYTETFRRIGFETGLCWYGNSRINWEQDRWNWREDLFDVRRPEWQKLNSGAMPPPVEATRVVPAQIHTPSLMVTAGSDHVLRPALTIGMEGWCTNLTRVHVDGASHWVQTESPVQVNAGLTDFLTRLGAWQNTNVVVPDNAPATRDTRATKAKL